MTQKSHSRRYNAARKLKPTELHYRVAHYLASKPPVWGEAAAAELGLTASKWWDTVHGIWGHPWFTFDATGPAGWTLTPAGRLAIEEKLK